MDVDNILAVFVRTAMFACIIYTFIGLYYLDWFLFADIPAVEVGLVDFECHSLLETDLTTDWYYQQCLLDREGTYLTMYEHGVLMFRVMQAMFVLLVGVLVGTSLSLIHFIKVLYKIDWVTATFKFRLGKLDAEHARNVWKNYPKIK